ncbi:hypothetical protein HDV57DRAFT_215756 [Trichoderma longibrachiatum]|uniref:Uncharacterized protein n=1 Tax=Trichoderma longibrachiatum ATCC 18648 TaxID=983965 RepID=A0A2T4C7R5_TRILO|nr:hypothetical protein M440DRAFT_286318 [Trichoderma longibrachiatum ATCC 18648]
MESQPCRKPFQHAYRRLYPLTTNTQTPTQTHNNNNNTTGLKTRACRWLNHPSPTSSGHPSPPRSYDNLIHLRSNAAYRMRKADTPPLSKKETDILTKEKQQQAERRRGREKKGSTGALLPFAPIVQRPARGHTPPFWRYGSERSETSERAKPPNDTVEKIHLGNYYRKERPACMYEHVCTVCSSRNHPLRGKITAKGGAKKDAAGLARDEHPRGRGREGEPPCKFPSCQSSPSERERDHRT